MSTDIVENPGTKDKELLEENGYSLVESDSAGLRVQICSQIHEALFTHQMGEPQLD